MARRYCFTKNDPFDKDAPIELVVDAPAGSAELMARIRAFEPPPDTLALWFLGQNSFVLRPAGGPLIAIDPYLSDSCAETFAHLPFRLSRQLPVFIEPEDLDVDFVLCTHSHDDHADPETLRRMPKGRTRFVGPFEAYQRFLQCGVVPDQATLVHPNQTLDLAGVTLHGAFALPTDHVDLNHMGFVLRTASGLTFYNSGDTAPCDLLAHVAQYDIDVAAVCINGGFLNLSHYQAACVVQQVDPTWVVPCHYDMMVNNVGDPDMFRASLALVGSRARFKQLDYAEPWVVRKEPRER